MSRWTRLGGALFAIGVAACGSGGGDATKGEQLHRACLGCHDTELYTPDRAKIRTSAELRKAVIDWNDRMNPKFTEEEIDDVVAYLERDFYRFAK